MKPPPGGRRAFAISPDARPLGDKHDRVMLLCVIMRILRCEARHGGEYGGVGVESWDGGVWRRWDTRK